MQASNVFIYSMNKVKTMGRVVKQINLIVLINRKFTNIDPSKVFKKAKFLFFCMIFVTGCLFAQIPLQKRIFILDFKKPLNPFPISLSLNDKPLKLPDSKPFLSPNYYSAHLSFFCKQEIKMEKVAKIQIKFRVGSVEECDRMEGKRKYQ